MKRQTLFKAHAAHFVLALFVPLALVPNCKRFEGGLSEKAETATEQSFAENDTCKYITRVLATSVITREEGKPQETTLPFEVHTGPVPVCVSVTSIEAKPRVLAAGRFALDGEEVLGSSTFNQNTVTAAATRELRAGSHTLNVRLGSAPGTKVRVYVHEASKTPPFADALVVATGVLVPDKETTIDVAGGTFTFPVGAVDAPVEVTIVPEQELYGIGNRFDLYPDGLQFNVPVPVAIPYDPMSLPSTHAEVDLLAAEAIKVLHDGEWRQTTVAPNRILQATIEHFSHAKPGIVIPVPREFPGYQLYTDDSNGVHIAAFPLGQTGYHASIHAERVMGDPNQDSRWAKDKWYKLKPVTAHVAALSTPFIAINATSAGAWSGDANDDFRCNWGCGLPLTCDCADMGYTGQDHIGTGTFSWSVNTTEPSVLFSGQQEVADDKSTIKKANIERLMVIGSTDQDGLYARFWPETSQNRYEDATKQLEEMKNKGGHAVLLGSNIWDINKSNDPADPCTGQPDDTYTFVAIAQECSNCARHLLLITSMADRSIKDKLCNIVDLYHIQDAMALDGGDSTMMVQNGAQLFKNTSANYKPARNVVNAFAIAPAMSISAPSCASVDQDFPFGVTSAPSQDGHTVTVHCASDGVTRKAQGIAGQSVQEFTFSWSTIGEKVINCTTFNSADGNVIATAETKVQVGQVISVSPTFVPLGQQQTFTITGKNLCSSTVAWLDDCDDNDSSQLSLPSKWEASLPDGTETRTFTCTPGGDDGARTDSVIKTKAGGIPYLINGKPNFTATYY